VYVAIQPRYGPGIGTATKAALLIWIVGVVVFYIAEVSSGTTPLGISVATTMLALVTFVPAVWIACKLLSEQRSTLVGRLCERLDKTEYPWALSASPLRIAFRRADSYRKAATDQFLWYGSLG
jgi:hypothetical protein